ncbi:MAG: hypothetical protein HFE45_11620 [Oscillospiraceae bacterium]|nr:hypothetical protein [Oscillospiraceae bacterium]
MQLYKLVSRELTETELQTIAHFRYYYDQKKCFALIGGYAAAVLSDDRAGSLEKLRQEALENMASLLNVPPDFSAYVMDDGFGLAEMDFGIYAVSPSPLSDEEIAANRMGVAAALAARSACLEACSAGEIIAIVDEA